MLKKILFGLLAVILVLPGAANAQGLSEDLSGRILLQVERNGEAWYVNPVDLERYFMSRPADAFQLMHDLGLGVTNNDLASIPMGYVPLSGTDSDGDGLSDIFEDSQGTASNNPDSDGDGFYDREEIIDNYSPLSIVRTKNQINTALRDRLKGRILIQAQDHGEAWYLNPVDGKRYFLGRPADAFEIMRQFGLGITNANLDLVTPTNALTTYHDPLFSIAYPQYWDINNPRITIIGSFFAAYPEFRLTLSDDDLTNVLDIQTIRTDLNLSLQDRVDIMRERYTTFTDTKYILIDEATTVDGHDAWTIHALQKSDTLIHSDSKDDITTVIQVNPGQFLAVSIAIERTATYTEDLARYNEILTSLVINEANWKNYNDYSTNIRPLSSRYTPILSKKVGHESSPNYIEIDDRLSFLVPAGWDLKAMDLTDSNDVIDGFIREFLSSATEEELELLANERGITINELQDYLQQLIDLTWTDLIAIRPTFNDSQEEEFTIITRTISPDLAFWDEKLSIDSFIDISFLESIGISITPRFSKNIIVDGYSGIMKESIIADQESDESIIINATQLLLPDNVVYTITLSSKETNYDQTFSKFESLLNSITFVK